ncbi:MAG: hypothetical protein KDA78_11890 [Planctomycetaceae bacterium]|nr:hypothetical protein [Planctomycetaceae bacterium]
MTFRYTGFILGVSLLTASAVQADLREHFDAIEVRTGALYLQRSNFADDVIFSTSSAELTAQDVQQGEDTGWELSLFGQISDCKRIEFRYFHLDGFHFGESYTDPGGIVFNTQPFGSGLVDFPVAANLEYGAELTNYEINSRCAVNPDLEWFWGVRHIRSRDQLAGYFERIGNPGTNNHVAFGANNYLTGVQCGLDAVLADVGPFSLEALVKAGLYHNQVQTSYSETQGAISVVARKDVPAFVGELQLTGVYHINSSASCRIGYQFLVMTNIATAPNQVTNSVRFPAPSTVAMATDSPIYQGIFAQLDFYLYD